MKLARKLGTPSLDPGARTSYHESMRVEFVQRKRPAFGTMEILWGGAIALLIFTWVWDFQRHPISYCSMQLLFGIPCPACGMTRAFVHMTHFHLGAAISASPLGAVLCSTVVAFALYIPLAHWRGRVFRWELSRREARLFPVILIVVILVNWGYLLWSEV